MQRPKCGGFSAEVFWGQLRSDVSSARINQTSNDLFFGHGRLHHELHAVETRWSQPSELLAKSVRQVAYMDIKASIKSMFVMS